MASSPTVSATEAAHVLYAFGQHKIGYPAGNFITTLIEAIMVADFGNRTSLGLGFPGYVEAVRMAKEDDDGIDRLEAIVRPIEDEYEPW